MSVIYGHRVVGQHDVQATVTRRSDLGEEEAECMFILVEIEDTNKCTLPRGHAMRHERGVVAIPC